MQLMSISSSQYGKSRKIVHTENVFKLIMQGFIQALMDLHLPEVKTQS